MKITDVETIYLRIPDLDEERCDGTQDTLVVKIHTDEGIVGIGEIDSVPLVVQSIIQAPPSHKIATGLKELLLGEDPLEVERLWEKMYQGTIYYGRSGPVIHAMSGIDMALWDIIGKITGKKVSDMLGGTYRKKIKAYASELFPETLKEASELAEKYMKLGYKAIKFGWGPFGLNDDFDEEMIRVIRETVGDDVDLMIDVGYAWENARRAISMSNRLEKYNIYWVEEPLHPDDLQGYKTLAENVNVNIAAGECESSRRSYQRLINEGGVDIIQPDLGRCGGLTEARKIAVFANDQNIKVVPHSFKTGILVSASAHFVASLPQGELVEYTTSESPLAKYLVETSLEFKDGYLNLSDEKGLGIQLNDDIVKKYRMN